MRTTFCISVFLFILGVRSQDCANAPAELILSRANWDGVRIGLSDCGRNVLFAENCIDCLSPDPLLDRTCICSRPSFITNIEARFTAYGCPDQFLLFATYHAAFCSAATRTLVTAPTPNTIVNGTTNSNQTSPGSLNSNPNNPGSNSQKQTVVFVSGTLVLYPTRTPGTGNATGKAQGIVLLPNGSSMLSSRDLLFWNLVAFFFFFGAMFLA